MGTLGTLLWVGAWTSTAAFAAGHPTGYNVAWAVAAGGSGDDQARGVVVRADGQSHVTGYFQGTATFGAETLLSQGGYDLFVATYDRAGTLRWVRSAGGEGQDWALGVAAAPTGDTFVAGYFQDEATFGAIQVTSAGAKDGFVACYDAGGAVRWVATFGGAEDEEAYAVSADGSGGCVVAGYVQAGARFGVVPVSPQGGVDAVVARYNADGGLVWVRTAGGSSLDVAQGVAADDAGGGWVTGYFASTNAVFGAHALSAVGGTDLFTARFDAAGDYQWAAAGGGTNSDYGTAVVGLDAGDALVTGTFRGAAVLGPTNLTSVGGQNMLLARYGSGGQVGWVKSGGATDGRDVGGGGAGSLVIGDYVATVVFETNTLTSVGGKDIYLAQYGPDGSLSWVRSLGSTNADYGASVAAGSDAACVFAGSFGGTLDFEGVVLTNRGAADILVSRLTPAPVLLVVPQGQTVEPGTAVTLAVSAGGVEPLTYQWYFNETNRVDLAVMPALILTNLTTAQSGLYSVVVTNAFGTATSPPVFLNVFGLVPPRVRVNGALGTTFEVTNAPAVELTLEAMFPGASLYYTLDGSLPTSESTPYSGPVTVTRSGTCRAVAYTPTLASAVAEPVVIRFLLTPPVVRVNGQIGTSLSFTNLPEVTVELDAGLAGASLAYTLDGTAPGTNAPPYAGPFALTNSAVIRALAWRDGMESGASEPVSVRLRQLYTLNLDTLQDGTVELTPPGGVYLDGTAVQLTAQPAPGWTFLDWTGDLAGSNRTTSVTLERSLRTGARFGTPLTLTAVGDGALRVEPAATAYVRGANLRARALPAPGHFFTGWGGVGQGTNNPLDFSIGGPNPTLSALFSVVPPNHYSLTVDAAGRGSVTVDPILPFYPLHAAVTVMAVPEAGARFLTWAGHVRSLANPLHLTLTNHLEFTGYFTGSGFLLLEAPQFGSGGFTFQIVGDTGQVGRVEFSDDLATWPTLIRVTNTLGTETVRDPITNSTRRIYRAQAE